MTDTKPADAGPASYSIEKLLTQTVQPFPDLPAEEFDILKRSIKDRGLLHPIALTVDGYLFDGHQRLKTLIANGRKRIAADDVRIMCGVNRENMLAHAYASNLVRRMVTAEQKAACMHRLAASGWSQRRIAKEFSMSQSGASQLMATYPPEGGLPEVIVTHGEDGKTYTRMPSKNPKGKPVPWAVSGDAMRSVRRTYKFVRTELPTGLDEWEKTAVVEQLEGLQGAIGEMLANMETM
jgi:hypothetical protein